MTKKVLVGLEDIEYIGECLLNRYGNDVSDWLARWFDDQPDVSRMSVEDFVNMSAIYHRQEVKDEKSAD